ALLVARDAADRNATAERSARLAVERHQARLALNQGLAMCEQDDVAGGLLWLVRGLVRAESAGDPDLAPAARLNLAGWSALLPRPGPLLRPPSRVRCGAFRPDGKVVAVGCEEGEVAFWDAATGRAIGDPLRPDPSAIREVSPLDPA